MPNMVDVILQGFANALLGLVHAFETNPWPFILVGILAILMITGPFIRRAIRRRS
ncbi:hypothetical protein BJY17_001206 [Agromyces hippuratus]|uniref:Uncharacterized protein n=1 Tax=Agromyces hippuratus TaxID=286438 RepID=A0A852WR44_9MICO|nr:hypothetical protein [Agromyces hippuratus]NYG20459.1 hypothetical protein [Agromyces hippuratus]